MIKRIRTHFQDKAARRAEEALFASKLEVLTDAIAIGDNKTFSAVFAGVKNSSLYTSAVSDDLLNYVITTDNKPAFSAILRGYEDPNIWFTSNASVVNHRGGGGVTIAKYEHVLGRAIRSGSSQIALALVKNKKVSVENSGRQETYYGLGKPTITPYKTPLELAQEKGMTEVEQALRQRLAAPAPKTGLEPKP